MKLSFKTAWHPAPKKASKKPARKPRDNPRVPCGVVSKKHNKFVGATITFKGRTSKIVGCSVSPDGKTTQFATRALSNLGKTTRSTPVSKKAVRDLAYRKPSAVKLAKHSKKGTRTPAQLIAAFEARYGMKKASKKSAARGSKKPAKKGKLTGAAKAAFLAKMAKGRAAAGR